MILSLENVSKSFHQGQAEVRVLNDLHLDVKKGEKVAIVGPSGSGKTTLLSLAAGLDRLDLGSIRILGRNIEKMSEQELSEFRSKHIGIVFQQFHLMPHFTALENVSLPLELQGAAEAHVRAQRVLEEVGLSHRLEHRPSELSGGESQRVAIARALVVDPDIMLADEPSGNLDAETGDHVMNLLFELVEKRQMTLLLVTHNDVLAKKCDRVLTIHHGEINA